MALRRNSGFVAAVWIPGWCWVFALPANRRHAIGFMSRESFLTLGTVREQRIKLGDKKNSFEIQLNVVGQPLSDFSILTLLWVHRHGDLCGTVQHCTQVIFHEIAVSLDVVGALLLAVGD